MERNGAMHHFELDDGQKDRTNNVEEESLSAKREGNGNFENITGDHCL